MASGEVAGPKAATRGPSWRMLLITSVVVLAAAVAFVVVAARNRSSQSAATAAGEQLRPTGIPSTVSTPLATLMALSPVKERPAPGFSLTDQNGRRLSLAGLKGHPVVLEFMDPHCTDICPIVSQEFVDAYHDLGPLGRKVVFVAINVNRYHASVAAVARFSAEHDLTSIPTWHFLTGPVPLLRKAWKQYGIAVQAPSPNADIIHSSIVYFIAPNGKERYLASPQVDHTKAGKAFLPVPQLSGWGRGIALVARSMLS